MKQAKHTRWGRKLILALAGVVLLGFALFEVVRPRNETRYYDFMNPHHRPYVFGERLKGHELKEFEYAYVKVDYGSDGKVERVTKYLDHSTVADVRAYEYSWTSIRETTTWYEVDEKGNRTEHVHEAELSRLTWWVPGWLTG